MPNQNPPRKTGKAAMIVAALVLIIAAITFVGLNTSHYQAAQREENGQLPQDSYKQDAKPQGPHDLGTEPRSHK